MKKKKEEEIINLKKQIQNSTYSKIIYNEKEQMSTSIDKIKSLEEELSLAKEENNKVESLEKSN